MSEIVVVAIAKNEADHILEWIAYHRVIGVDHFVIFENESSDDTASLLATLASHGVVTVMPWATRDEYPFFEGRQIGPQLPAYREGLSYVKALDRWKWVGVLDIDEFVVLDCAPNLPSFLSKYEKHGAVGLNWKMFGSSHLSEQPPGLMVKNLTWRAADDFSVHRHVKAFSLIKGTDALGIHIPTLNTDCELVDTGEAAISAAGQGLHERIVFSEAWVNHYFTKSTSEAERKRLRGRASVHPNDPNRIRRTEEFTWSDRNEVQDLTILRWEDALRRELSYLTHLVRSKRSGGDGPRGVLTRLFARLQSGARHKSSGATPLH